jgi:hypothetical protein
MEAIAEELEDRIDEQREEVEREQTEADAYDPGSFAW